MNATTEPLTGDPLLVAISSAISGIQREAGGRGPDRCSAHWTGPDLLVVLLTGGFTVAEKTLAAGGATADVRASRLVLADVLQARLTGAVEALTGRQVLAFMTGTHQGPDYQLAAFVLAPRSGADANSVMPAAKSSSGS